MGKSKIAWKDVDELIEMSRAAGIDPKMVQGGGGNTSVKSDDGEIICVKASGTALKDMTRERGWVALTLEDVVSPIEDSKLQKMKPANREAHVLELLMKARTGGEPDGRPSVEASLHALMKGKCILHTHPTVLNGILCSRKSREMVDKLAKVCKTPPLWIPYTNPGFPLAVAVNDASREYRQTHGKEPEYIFIESHGLFVSAKTGKEAVRRTKRVLAEADRLTRTLVKSARTAKPIADMSEIAGFIAGLRGEIARKNDAAPLMRVFESDLAVRLMARPDFRRIIPPALTPDDMVYCGHQAAVASKNDIKKPADFLKRFIRTNILKESPKVVFLPGVGYLGIASGAKALRTINEVYESHLETIERSLVCDGPKPLSKRDVMYLAGWEVPQYRKQVAAGKAEGTLNGQIALVTGAGSGLGRSIALGLADAGAVVALLDVDASAAHDTGTLIAEQLGEGRTFVCTCDVTDENAVVTAFEEVALNFGGLDLAVLAAGIAPAFPLVDFPVKAWRKALDINLTGYFLVAREAAKVMIRQGLGGSIVAVSSKSGLDASSANSAYNAAKAGEIHLIRGWAKELGKHKIRCNAVAPGNVFEGSKIWNPEYIKMVAKKRGIKPEEVIPYYINLTALKEDIKGRDIANAIIFLASDSARVITGQILVADAGQVFVR
jgi:NAD(P)-dependent dehydrogenase (short-subunit alcohol dehydrogenase family)/rhamnose utilization protein RhaD (predicted bifunctional aldolase and dehydrogenase)